MCVRIAVLAGAVNVGILPRLSPVVGAMLVTGAVAASILAAKAGPSDATSSAKITNPFRLRSALTFGLLFALTLLVARGAQEYIGIRGVYAAAVLSSLADVDAAAIAFTRMGAGETGWRVAAIAVAVAAVTNTLVKLGIALAMGAGKFRRYVAITLGLMALAGIIAIVFMTSL
jgi:uncharacterized membrane protein (DUF4010 family)